MTVAIDPQLVTDIVNKINAMPDCSQLEAYVSKQLQAWVKQQQSAITAKANAALKKVAPTNLGEVISWIQHYVTEAQTDYTNAVTAIAEISAAYATVTAAITAKISRMSCSMTSIPTLPTP